MIIKILAYAGFKLNQALNKAAWNSTFRLG